MPNDQKSGKTAKWELCLFNRLKYNHFLQENLKMKQKQGASRRLDEYHMARAFMFSFDRKR